VPRKNSTSSGRPGKKAFGLLGLVADARGRDHGSVSSTATIFSHEQASSRHGWGVSDGYNIAACTFASFLISGRVWALNRSWEM
jgi:hypothetical protein